MTKLIALEGNIGAGKSTLLLELSTRLPPGWVVLEEPVDTWSTFKDVDGRTMLEKFYADPARYAFAFQIMAFTTRLRALESLLQQQPVGIVCERSLAADHEVFAKMLRDDGCLEQPLYDIYAALTEGTKRQPECILYLNVGVDTCMQRMATRGRVGEDVVEAAYLTKCEAYYKTWLTHTSIPVHQLDGTHHMSSIIDEALSRVLQS